MESHWTSLILWRQDDDTREVLSTREAPLNLGVPGFSWGSVTEVPDAQREDMAITKLSV